MAPTLSSSRYQRCGPPSELPSLRSCRAATRTRRPTTRKSRCCKSSKVSWVSRDSCARLAVVPIATPSTTASWRRLQRWTPDLLMLPALLAIVLVMALPLLYLLFMSVHKWSMIGYAPPSFVGSSNFLALVDDQRFIDSLGRTLYFTALGLASNVPLGFAIALLLAENFPTRDVLRALLILP